MMASFCLTAGFISHLAPEYYWAHLICLNGMLLSSRHTITWDQSFIMLWVGIWNIAKLVTRTVRIRALKCGKGEGNQAPPTSLMHFCSCSSGWYTVSPHWPSASAMETCSVWKALFRAIWSPCLPSIKPFQTVSTAPLLSLTLSGSWAGGSHGEGETAGYSPGSVIQLVCWGKSLNLSLPLPSNWNNATRKVKWNKKCENPSCVKC